MKLLLISLLLLLPLISLGAPSNPLQINAHNACMQYYKNNIKAQPKAYWTCYVKYIKDHSTEELKASGTQMKKSESCAFNDTDCLSACMMAGMLNCDFCCAASH